MGRVLVTGATGFIGRHLVAALIAEGSPTVALGQRPEALAELSHPALSLALGDVRDAATCARLLAGVDMVFHLAAVRNRPGSSVAEMTAVNEAATLRLARQAAEAGVGRFVHLATALIYGPSAAPVDETLPLVAERAGSYYAAGKARAVLGLRQLADDGVPVVTLCPTIVFGPDHPSRPNRVTAHLRRLLRRRFDVVLGDGEARRDLVHVADVVTAMLAAARLPRAVGEEILVTGEPVSQRGLGVLVARCVGRRRPLTVSLPVRLAITAARLLDRTLGYDPRCGVATAVETLSRGWSYRGDKARAVLDHQPRPLARGIAETVAWIRGGQAR